MIPAHDNPLAAIAFNAQGTKIATASEKVSSLHYFQPYWHVNYMYTNGPPLILALEIDRLFDASLAKALVSVAGPKCLLSHVG